LAKEILIPKISIRNKVKELANQISADYADEEPIMIGILNGVIFFFADLVREISLPVHIDFIRASSYGSGRTSSGEIKVTKDVELAIRDRHVVIIEDIVDTGLTLHRIIEKLRKREPASIKTCVLIDKVERRLEEINIDYPGFQVKEGFLVGYGLDYNEQYRHLPDIYILR
jgi:hypoxanthine phosphoribosyltransferase